MWVFLEQLAVVGISDRLQFCLVDFRRFYGQSKLLVDRFEFQIVDFEPRDLGGYLHVNVVYFRSLMVLLQVIGSTLPTSTNFQLQNQRELGIGFHLLHQRQPQGRLLRACAS